MKKIFIILFLFFGLNITYGAFNQNCISNFGQTNLFNKNNSGCPILEQSCETSPCKSGFFCNAKKVCEVQKPQELVGTCIYPLNNSSIYGNVVCDSCPCNLRINFLENFRKCDLVFPAVVSKDGKNIFSRGNVYEIK